MNLRNRCPSCQSAPIFNFLSMHPKCPGCGMVFYREAGYFLGAMVLSYFASSGIGILLLLVLFAGLKMEIITAAVISVCVVLMLTPILYRYSRIFWIQIDRRADPGAPPASQNSLQIKP